jgi:hypothetical protein
LAGRKSVRMVLRPDAGGVTSRLSPDYPDGLTACWGAGAAHVSTESQRAARLRLQNCSAISCHNSASIRCSSARAALSLRASCTPR